MADVRTDIRNAQQQLTEQYQQLEQQRKQAQQVEEETQANRRRIYYPVKRIPFLTRNQRLAQQLYLSRAEQQVNDINVFKENITGSQQAIERNQAQLQDYLSGYNAALDGQAVLGMNNTPSFLEGYRAGNATVKQGESNIANIQYLKAKVAFDKSISDFEKANPTEKLVLNADRTQIISVDSGYLGMSVPVDAYIKRINSTSNSNLFNSNSTGNAFMDIINASRGMSLNYSNLKLPNAPLNFVDNLKKTLGDKYNEFINKPQNKLLKDIIQGKPTGATEKTVNVFDQYGNIVGTQNVLVPGPNMTLQQRLYDKLKQATIYKLNPQDIKDIEAIGAAATLAATPELLPVIGLRNFIYGASFLQASNIRNLVNPLLNVFQPQTPIGQFTKGGGEGLLFSAIPPLGIAYGKGFISSLLLNPTETAKATGENIYEFLGGIVSASLYTAATKAGPGTALKQGENVRYEITSKTTGEKFILEIPYKIKDTFVTKDKIQPIILPNGELVSLADFTLKRIASERVTVGGQSFLSSLLFSSEQIIGNKRIDTTFNTEPIITDMNGNIINFPTIKTQREGASLSIASLLTGNQIPLEVKSFDQLPNEVQINLMQLYESELGRPVNRKLAKSIYTRQLKIEQVKLSSSSVSAKRIFRTTQGVDAINILLYKKGRTITRSGMVTSAVPELILPTSERFRTTTSALDLTFPKVKARGQKPLIIKGKTVINQVKDMSNILTGSNVIKRFVKGTKAVKNDALNSVTDLVVKQKQERVVRKATETLGNVKGAAASSMARIKNPKAPSVKSNPLREVSALVSSAYQQKTSQKVNVRISQQERTVQGTSQKSNQIIKFSALLSNPSAIKESQREITKQTQKETQVQKQPSLLRFDSILVQPPSLSRPSPPTANQPKPFFSPLFDNKKKSRKKVVKSSRKNKRQYALSPTLTQGLIGIRRRKPIPLSKLTGFEAITI